MREILFRGYNKMVKKWYYGYLVKFDNQYYIKDGSGTEPFVEEDSIGQYTGFKDKNGKEIYEGDIIRVDDDTDYEIMFDDDNGWIAVHEDDTDTVLNLSFICDECDGEVIGNIYEDKLKEGK